MGGKPSDDVRRNLALAHVIERRVVDHIVLAPGPQQRQEVQP